VILLAISKTNSNKRRLEMGCCLETNINCCKILTTTAAEFIAAVKRTTGLTKQGIDNNKMCCAIIADRL
jgi:hypothetical protein